MERMVNNMEIKGMNGATKFVDWLLEMGYLDEEDIATDGVDIAMDMNKVKEIAPKFYNMLMCMCNCEERAQERWVDVMDFITRGDRDLIHTEMFYGKKSDQYALHSLLLDAENRLKMTGSLKLGKMCKQEYILITFYTKVFDNTTVGSMVKSYWSTDKTEMKKRKEKVIGKSISSVIDNDVYDLILNGKYQVVE